MHVVVQQKPTQHCKAIVPPIKKQQQPIKLNKAKQMYNLAQMVNKQTASFITIKEKYKILPVA